MTQAAGAQKVQLHEVHREMRLKLGLARENGGEPWRGRSEDRH